MFDAPGQPAKPVPAGSLTLYLDVWKNLINQHNPAMERLVFIASLTPEFTVKYRP